MKVLKVVIMEVIKMRAVVVNQASTGVEVVDHEKPAVVVMVKLW